MFVHDPVEGELRSRFGHAAACGSASSLVHDSRHRLGRPAQSSERLLPSHVNRRRLPGLGFGSDSSGGQRSFMRQPS